MNLLKRVSTVLLVTMLVITSIPLNIFGSELTNTTLDNNESIVISESLINKPIVETVTKSAITASNGTNLLKITKTDFEEGDKIGLVVDDDGALTLESGKTEGIFYSPIYEDLDLEYLVTSWNAYLPGESTVEVEAIAFIAKDPTVDPNIGEWSDYLTWGEWGPQARSGSISTKSADTTLAYMSVDEFTVRTPSSTPNQGATKVQFRITLKQGENTNELPALRQVSATWANTIRENTRGYAETPVTTVASIRIEAPAYSQNIRDPEIGGSICNPTTLTVMLNQRNSDLDLLPEELALTVQDFNYGFGNWSYTGSAPGLYGYESYAQYGNFEIVRQELSKGHTVGMSVRYTSYENGTYPYLVTGAANSTAGHLITLTGFYYDKDINDFVYYSTDSATPNDYVSSGEHRRYQEKHLSNAGSGSKNLIYIIPSLDPISNKISGIEKIDGQLDPAGNKDEYKLIVNKVKVELDPEFTSEKQNELERGVLAYSIEGIKTEMPEYVTKNLTANNTFFYTNVDVNESGNIEFDVNTAFRENNIPVGEQREVTFYVMLNTAKSYKATLTLERTDDIFVNSEDGYCDVIIDGNNINVYGEVSSETSTITLTIKGETVSITAKEPSYTFTVGNLTYNVDTIDVIVTPKHTKTVKDTNIIFIKGEEFTVEESTLINSVIENNIITLDSDETGYYYSAVYNVDTFKYLTASWEAITPGKSSVEIEIRAYRDSDQDSWTQWYSFGEWGTGIESTSKASSDDKGTMDVDVFNPGAAVNNANKLQVRVTLNPDGRNRPELHGVTLSFRNDSPVKTAIAEINGNIKSSVNFKAYSSYSYFGKMAGWRFENMMFMLINNQGADLLFEEVALRGYDFNTGAGNWAFIPSKARTFGYAGFLQYGASTDVIKEYINNGVAVGLLANTKYLNSTNSNVNRPIIIYNYDESAKIFYLVCPSGDTSELNNGDVYFESSESVLQKSIDNGGNAPGRWLMFIVGTDLNNKNNLNRTKADLTKKSDLVYELAVQNKEISLPNDFIETYNTKSGGGVIMYSLESENPDEPHKLADREYYYDIKVDDGSLLITEELQAKIDKGDTAQVFLVTNDGITYKALIEKEKASDPGDTAPPKKPTESKTSTDNKAANFTDINNNMWYYDAVKYVANTNIMKGTSESLFSPNAQLSREMAITILHRYAGEPGVLSTTDYSDVKNSDYFYNAIHWASQNDIVKGYGNNLFGTGNNLTREDFAAILYRYAKSIGMDVSNTDISKYEDSNQISSWAVEALGWANAKGLIVGKTSSALAPKDFITRAEAATIIMRFNEL